MKNPNKMIMGAAIGIAAITTAIDHTRHKLPEPEESSEQANIIIEGEEDSSPCSLDSDSMSSNSEEVVIEESESSSPCGLGD